MTVMFICVHCGQDWFGQNGQFEPERCAHCGSTWMRRYIDRDIRQLERHGDFA